MLSALDTNVISALWSKEPANKEMAELLFEVRQVGGIMICAPVYAELMVYPRASQAFVDAVLADTRITVDTTLERDVWERVGESYSAYAQRRREDRAGQPKRLLVDFIVGAHALLQANRLLTLDAKRYLTAYPALELLP